MKIKVLPGFLMLMLHLSSLAQTGMIKGKVTDSKSGEALVGVSVSIDASRGTTTDLDGNYTVETEAGSYTIKFSYLGYADITKDVKVLAGQTLDLGITGLSETLEELDIVTVTGSKFERRVAKEVSTIDVLKSDFINSTNSVKLAEAINKVPGVTLIDNQPAIRGGSGYAYGVGSRVLVMLDDIPMITADRGDIRWNYLPIEITEQVEVLKGSASALYGASALNGVINVRTKFPRDKPETEASAFYHIYASPRNDTMKWWGEPNTKNIDETLPRYEIVTIDSSINPPDTTITYTDPDTSVHLTDPTLPPPQRYGGFFSHSHRIGRFDVIIGVGLEKEIGYIRLLDQQFVRVSGKFRHRPKKVDRLTYGLNFYFMDSKEADYFFWKNSLEGAFVPAGSDDYDDEGTLTRPSRQNITLDPYVNYLDSRNGRHQLRFRFNRLYVQFSSMHPVAYILHSEYQYQKKFKRIASITGGISEQHYDIEDRDFKNHKFEIGAIYAQVDLEIKKLTISAGGRAEIFKLDSRGDTTAFTFKLGLNYQVGKRTYLRASAGTGYRYPAVAEFFANASLGDVGGFGRLYALGNPDLLPEYGGTGEIGLKQGFRISKWLGYFDFAIFWQEYKNMIEFIFNLYELEDGLLHPGFKSYNISRARVAGFDMGIFGDGKLGKFPFRMLAGYTYTYPVELNATGGDTTLNNVGNYLEYFFKGMGNVDKDVLDGLLRYRYRHTLKADLEVDLSHFILGTEFQYYSFMDKVDGYLEIVASGLADYRKQAQERTITGDIFWNLRAGYDFQKYGKLMLIVNNVLNRESAIRPAKMDPPLNFVIQYSIKVLGK